MATYYLDPEGGNDSNDGTTFANRWKTVTSGATAARIGPGDTIRVMASPDPVSVGNATWTNGPRPAQISIASSTNATPIEITTGGAHGLSANDYVSVASHTINTNANGIWKVGAVNSTTKFTIVNIDGTNTTGNGTGGATGNVTKINNCMVKFGSPVAKNIFCGGLKEKGAWTGVTNVNCSQGTSVYKEGYSAPAIAVTASFTGTGKAAYYTLPSTLDLSAYQRLCFWVQINSGTVNTGSTEAYLALCTDTTGDTIATSPDHKFYIPLVGATQSWVPVFVDLGSAMSGSIKSIAFYIATNKGAQTFIIDNIVAVGSTLNLASLIGKNSTDNEEWYALQFLNHDVAMIANHNSLTSLSSSIRGYYGTSETATTYSRETVKFTPAASSIANINTVNDSGSSGSPILFSGGWDRTNMSTQSGETWWDGQNGNGRNIHAFTRNYVNVEKINSVRFTTGIYYDSCTYCNLESIKITACNSGIDGATYCVGSVFNNVLSYNNNTTGVNLYYGAKLTNGKKIHNNVTNGLTLAGGLAKADTVYAHNNGTSGIVFGSNCTKSYVINGESSYNGNYGINNSAGSTDVFAVNVTTNGNVVSSTGTTTGNLYLNNCTLNEATEASISTSYTGAVFCNRADGADNNSIIYYNRGVITQQSSVVDSPATTSWKLSPTNSTYCTNITPLSLKIGTVICKASALVTVTARMRRSNTGLTISLVCPGGQILGVDNDVSSDLSASADTWATVTITFTPTKPGAVDIYAYAYGGTTYNGYVSNITASQA